MLTHDVVYSHDTAVVTRMACRFKSPLFGCALVDARAILAVTLSSHSSEHRARQGCMLWDAPLHDSTLPSCQRCRAGTVGSGKVLVLRSIHCIAASASTQLLGRKKVFERISSSSSGEMSRQLRRATAAYATGRARGRGVLAACSSREGLVHADGLSQGRHGGARTQGKSTGGR